MPPIRTYVQYDIVDTAPNKDKIVESLSMMKPRKTPGASGITTEDLKGWYHKARIAYDKTADNIALWEKNINIITLMFTTGDIPSSFYNAVLVLVPKLTTKVS
jgi:hypothetical protein